MRCVPYEGMPEYHNPESKGDLYIQFTVCFLALCSIVTSAVYCHIVALPPSSLSPVKLSLCLFLPEL